MEQETEKQGIEKVSPALSEEIDAAVNVVVQEHEAENRQNDEGKDKKTDLPPGEDQPGQEPGGETPDNGKIKKPGEESEGGEAEPVAITDTHIERAVKAGMTIADARSFKDAKALERVCSTLEAKNGGSETGKKPGEENAKKEEADPLAAIPDLDPAEYDEKVVAGFKAMKDIIRGQQTVISELKQAGGKAQAATWIDGQIAALGAGAVESLGENGKVSPGSPQAAKRTELQDKFDVLTAGYKAAGKQVEPETVFKEAVRVVLGDVEGKASSDARAEALAKRQGQRVARPSGHNRTEQGSDPFSDVAAEVDAKYFKK